MRLATRIGHHSWRNALLAATAAATSLIYSPTCQAQVRRYAPQKPTLSPYLGLTLFNNGSVPNYYAFVRPRQQQQAFNVEQQALIAQQQAVSLKHAGAIQGLETDVQRGLAPAAKTGTGSWFMNPGTRSTFLNTSQYYPAVNLPPPRQ
jgi:hypothetical protein